jgi:hypothetical protein
VAETTQTQVSETFKTEEWRMEQLQRAGIPKLYAKKLAQSESDLHKMLDAYAAGCSLPILLKIFR